MRPRIRPPHHPAKTLVLAVLLGPAVAACGGDDSTGPPSAESLDGVWTGSTSQGRSLSFTVSGGVVNSLTVGFQVSGSRCSVEGSVSVTGAETIRDGRVEADIAFVDPAITVSATFTSSDRAEGTITFQSGECQGSASATWTASKTGSLADIVSVDGTWRFAWEDMTGSAEGFTISCDVSGADFRLTQAGLSFTGTQQGSATQTCSLNGEQGAPQSASGETIVGGTISGASVSFSLGSFDAVQNGTISGSSMSGTALWNFPSSSGGPPLTLNGRFSATRLQ